MNFVRTLKSLILHATLVLLLAVASCNDMYDNIKEYSLEEKVYPAKFDTIFASIGFNRVELDLNKAGRIPASQIKLGKAKKTVVTWDDGKGRLEIDSICSWVNVTGLTESRLYRFSVYTEDQYGDRSVPLEIAVTPYTEADLQKLALTPPRLTESTSSALLEWQDHLSSAYYTMYDYTYEYLDKDNVSHMGEGNSDLPSFFVENVQQGQSVIVNIFNRILPIVDKKNLLDTVVWHAKYELNISENAIPAIFLKTPETQALIQQFDADVFPFAFEWTQTPEVTGYTLKISEDNNFSEDKTSAIDVGNTNQYVMSQAEFEAMLVNYHRKYTSLYWTVVPTVVGTPVRNQLRPFTAEKPRIDKVMFHNWDSAPVNSWYQCSYFFDTNNKKEGAASLSLTSPYVLDFFSFSMPAPIDLTSYGITKENGYFVFWMYVSDITQMASMQADGRLEVNGNSYWGAWGSFDINWRWDQLNLKNGWNEVELAFADGGYYNPAAPLNFHNVQHFRWWNYGFPGCGAVTVKIDAMQFSTY